MVISMLVMLLLLLEQTAIASLSPCFWSILDYHWELPDSPETVKTISNYWENNAKWNNLDWTINKKLSVESICIILAIGIRARCQGSYSSVILILFYKCNIILILKVHVLLSASNIFSRYVLTFILSTWSLSRPKSK